jgi:hypothetical protein
LLLDLATKQQSGAIDADVGNDDDAGMSVGTGKDGNAMTASPLSSASGSVAAAQGCQIFLGT